MIRRSFRLGLTLGLLAGVVFALVKLFGARPDHASAPAQGTSAPWPPLPPEPATAWVPSEAGAPAAPAAPASGSPAARPAKKAPLKAAPAPATTAKKAPLKASAASPATAAKKAPLKATPKKAPAKKQSEEEAPATTWVVPEGQVCPTSHPVKARLSSGIFHVPGMLNYLRTRPDRCYRDAASAEADGLRAAKR